jgi:hypothetical protein
MTPTLLVVLPAYLHDLVLPHQRRRARATPAKRGVTATRRGGPLRKRKPLRAVRAMPAQAVGGPDGGAGTWNDALDGFCFCDDGGIAYKLTTGIKWCSGGGDFVPSPADAFGAGADGGQCPYIPHECMLCFMSFYGTRSKTGQTSYVLCRFTGREVKSVRPKSGKYFPNRVYPVPGIILFFLVFSRFPANLPRLGWQMRAFGVETRAIWADPTHFGAVPRT